MSYLTRSNTRDQALLLRAIEFGSEAARKKGTSLGRTALQKIVYFMSCCGIPTAYRFDIHHFGPFCAEILDDVEGLLVDDLILDRSPDVKRSDYVVQGEAKELYAKHAKFLKQFDSSIRKVSGLASLPVQELELLSTVHFIATWHFHAGRGIPAVRSMVEQVRKLKGEKFTTKQVEEAFSRLRGARVIPSR